MKSTASSLGKPVYLRSRSLAMGLGGLFILAPAILAQVASVMTDPLFGIEFDPQQKHFETAPSTLTRRCHPLREKKFWIFARYESSGTTYYILNGYERYRPDGAPTTSPSYEPGSGVAVIVTASKCKVLSAEDFISSSTLPGPAPSGSQNSAGATLDGVAFDSVTRMISAFGGIEPFKAELAHAVATHDAYEATLPPALRSDYAPAIRKQITNVLGH